MLDDCFNKDRFLFEDKEGKNINRAEKWIKRNRPELIGKQINGRVMSRVRDVVTQIRHDIPSARLPYEVDSNGQRKKIKLSNGDIIDKGTCKYLPGVCRIYLNDLPNKTHAQAQLVKLTSRLSDLVNVIGLYFDKDFNDDDQGRDFNGMSFDELEAKYGKYVDELKRREREEAKSSLSKSKKNKDYRILKIDSFEDASEFSDYVSWCVTEDEDYFNDYTANGENRFYFVIRKDFQTVQEKDPSYATSMLAILINPDGSMDSNSGCTSRLNNGGRFMNPKQVQDLLGVDFYKTFKPISIDELIAKYKSEAIPSKIADKLGGIETEDGLHLVKNGRVQTWKKAYDGPEGKCYAYDHFVWFDDDVNEIAAPQEVGGSFNCSGCDSLTSLNGVPQKVGGDFNCTDCTSLTSFEGAPQEVGGNFYCSGCTSLTSLNGAPLEVGGDFNCQNCTSLTSLNGAPMEVGRNFYCFGCTSLTSLEGSPQKVSGSFDCSKCTSLKSLEGAPKEVGGDFYCLGCTYLTSLKGVPQKVGGNFNCTYCTSLTSFEGAPQEVGGNFYCSGCTSLTSLNGAPLEVGGDFNCQNCTSLTSLNGAPMEVGRNFYCFGCTSLTSLEGSPQKVSGSFDCSKCTSLKSLEGAPQEVGRNFVCQYCNGLTSLNGAPQKVGRDLDCLGCTLLKSLEGSPKEVSGYFTCSGCDSLTSLNGAPQEVGGIFQCDGTKISPRQKQSYLAWLKTNPIENYHEQTVSI